MARPRNPLFDALAIMDSPRIEELTAPGRVAKALQTIKKVTPDVTVDEIVRRARNLQLRWPRVTIKAMTLAANWGLASTPPAAAAPLPARTGNDRECAALRAELQTVLDPEYKAYLNRRLHELS